MIFTAYKELVGKQLQHDILDGRGVMLIPANTVLTYAHVSKLELFKISLFEIHVEAVAGPVDDTAPESLPLPANKHGGTESAWVKRTEGKMKEMEDYIHKTGKVPTADFEENVLPVILEATQQRNIYKLFADLKAEGDYRYNHSIGVAVIATTIGRWLNLNDQEMGLLTTAASLCDIGTVKLPSELVQKTSGLQPHEFAIMKQHTVIGHDLLLESGLDARIALVALQHHEKDDGSGYPAKLKGPQIDKLSKIVALADMYLAMTSDRPHRPALPFYQVVQSLHEEITRNRVDSQIGLTFLNRLMAAQIGSDVILSDGRRGRIVLTNANYPTKPLVALDNEFVDLSKNAAVQLTEIVG